jgi:large subunit ribosomal protein L21
MTATNDDVQTTPCAVIATGGKQYLITEGLTVSIEKLEGEFEVGQKIDFTEVLLTFDGKKTTIGSPNIEKAKITATLVEQGRGKKLHIMRYRAKSNYQRKLGHRQPFMKVKFDKVA